MSNWKIIFATVVIFGAGVITGGLLVNYVHNSHPKARKPMAEIYAPATNQMAHPPETAKLRPPEILSKQFLQRLQDNLQLASEQNEAIQKIIGDGQNEIRKTIQDSRLAIRAVLTPDQQKQFDDLMKRQFRKLLFNTNAPAANSPATNAPAI